MYRLSSNDLELPPRSLWTSCGSGLQDASAVHGTKQTQGAATRRLPRLESSGDLAALNTRHLLCKPVCGLKAPLGLSCPAGTAVLSGSLLQPKENIPGGDAFCKRHQTLNTRPRFAREALRHFPTQKRSNTCSITASEAFSPVRSHRAASASSTQTETASSPKPPAAASSAPATASRARSAAES